jgi:hypothetical protein
MDFTDGIPPTGGRAGRWIMTGSANIKGITKAAAVRAVVVTRRQRDVWAQALACTAASGVPRDRPTSACRGAPADCIKPLERCKGRPDVVRTPEQPAPGVAFAATPESAPQRRRSRQLAAWWRGRRAGSVRDENDDLSITRVRRAKSRPLGGVVILSLDGVAAGLRPAFAKP